MEFINYDRYIKNLPNDGKHIVASHDNNSIVVYQGLNKEIAEPAVKSACFHEPFRLDRLSWIKTNFMWMMYRSDWGILEERILAIYLKKSIFEKILMESHYSQFTPDLYQDVKVWRKSLKWSNVRIQWDPDYDPHKRSLKRRALQIGLSGEVLKNYARKWILKIEDLTDFVREQRYNLESGKEVSVPNERVYVPSNEFLFSWLQLG